MVPEPFLPPEQVEASGLVSCITRAIDLTRRSAYYLDKFLKGAKPTGLPVEQPMKFEFVVNLKTAKQIGMTMPPNVLVRADRVIRYREGVKSETTRWNFGFASAGSLASPGPLFARGGIAGNVVLSYVH